MTFRLTHILALLPLIFALTPLHAAQPPAITAKSALLLDANTGRVLFKKNEEERRPVASTQKLLTALIVAESGSLSKIVDISQGDGDCEPTKLYLKPGQSYSRSQLLNALLVKSANDVARVLARDNAGSVNRFAERMTQKMRELGGTSSNFVNPNGLPAQNQYSTARDMARVARAAYKNDTLREIMKTRSYDFRYSSGKVVPLRNTNRVLRTYSFCNGMKTGYTDLAGHCLISSGSYKGKDVISVVLGATKARCAQESAALLAYGLDLTPAQMSALRLPGASE
jgi:D-alanyl-D-alanine carboxypeptidase (penicillin-binding protein 5/6)